MNWCANWPGAALKCTALRLGGFWANLGSAIKKSLQASECGRIDIARERHFWVTRRTAFFNRALPRLVFIDETSTNTKLTKQTGWAPKGQRYRAEAPFGGWKTQTFIAGLRCHGLVAPWIIDRAMNRHIFDVYVETQLAPTLSKGDVVIMDNVAFHKSAKAERLIRDRGAWVLFLPAYSPDLNPIEMAYSKLKALLRKRAARSFDAVCQATGQICELFTPTECRNYFKAAGYELD